MPFDAAWEDGQTAHDDWLNAVEETLNRHEAAIAALGTQISTPFQYRFSATTTPPPGVGQIRYDNVDPTVATKVYIDNTTDTSLDISAGFSAMEAGDQLYFQLKTDSDTYARFDVTAVVVRTDHVELDVDLVEAAGSFVGNNIILFVHVRKLIA